MSMFRCLQTGVFAALVFHIAAPVHANDYDVLFQPFDARNFSDSDRRIIQTSLAFSGYYHGLLDGSWGRLERVAANSIQDSPEG